MEDSAQSGGVGIIQFKPVILISTQVVEAQRIRIEIADNDMAISKDITAQISDQFLMPNLPNPASHWDWLLSYRIIVEQHKGELKCFSERVKVLNFG